MRVPLSSSVARRHPSTASEAAIRAACEARAAAAALAHSEGREAVPYEPVMTRGPVVGGHYPEPLPGPALGQPWRVVLRDWSGIIAQGAALVVLAALAFLG